MAIADPERAIVLASQQVQVSERDLNMYREHFCKDAPPNEWAIFVQKCALYGLNPMLNEIYLVGRNAKEKIKGVDQWVKKFTTQVSITGIIALAERTGKYEGHTTPEYFDEDGNKYEIWSTKHGKHPYAIRIGVYKRGQREAPLITTYFHERAQYTGKDENRKLATMWESQGIHMLLKCALAAAVRWQFSEACSGIYIHEEMQSADASTPPVSILPHTVVEVPDGLQPTAQAVQHQNAPTPRSTQQSNARTFRYPGDTSRTQTKQADEQPKPVALAMLQKLADRYYPDGGWQATRRDIIAKFNILADISDEQLASEYNSDLKNIIAPHVPTKQPATASSGK